jgi:hypothetical protein
MMLTLLLPIAPLTGTAQKSYAAEYWAQPYLQNMLDYNIMTGNSQGNLNPSDKITRAEFATMINRALGFTTKGTTTFTDVQPTDWFYNDILIGAYEGYLQGTGSGKASPNSEITREAAVTMLGRALKLQTDSKVSNSFNDNSSISNWARPYVDIISNMGILSGYSDGSFSPSLSITRAEVAKVISNLTGDIVDDARQVRLDYVDGNVTLTSSGGGLKNTTISGDLYITDGVGTGSILLDNVTVLGNVIVSGAGQAESGECSIVFRDCEINSLITDVPADKKLSITTTGNTIINSTSVKSAIYIDSSNDTGSAFRTLSIELPEGQTADLSGTFTDVILKNPSNTLNLQKGYIANLTIDEESLNSTVFLEAGTDTGSLFCDTASLVKGTGTIGNSIISVDGTVIEQLPDNIDIRPGVTANINGKDMSYSDGVEINTIPEITAGYPKISDEDLKSANATFRVNKAAKLYWVIIPQGYTAPTDEQMINPKFIGSAVTSGNLNVSTAADSVVAITGLTEGTDYSLYAMIVDQRDTHSAIKKTDFSTVDTTSPKFTYTLIDAQADQKSDGTWAYNISALATVSKNATVYYVVQETGKAAPSASDMLNQKLTAVAKGFRDFKKNITTTLTITGFEEAATYDLYLLAVDDNSRQSAVFKKTVTMLDTTAPTMLRMKTVQGKNNIQITYTPDENCSKVYWTLYYTNVDTVNTIAQETMQTADGLMWYEKEYSKTAVIRASGAVQSASNLTAKASTDTTFNISNLEESRYYRLYMILEDASGNQSVIYTLETSTIDDVAPTAGLSLGSTDGESLYVGTSQSPTSISIVFNEVVLGRKGDTMKDLTLWDNSELSTWINLYRGDESSTSDSSRKMTIDWTNVKTYITTATAENPEHTVIEFSVSNGDTTALKLNTGESYTFVFNYNAAANIYIADKAGNTMKTTPTDSPLGGNYTSTTKTFKCVEPNVSIAAPAEVNTHIDYDGEEHYLDLTYRITPTEANKASNDENKYDYYFLPDSNVITNIFRLNGKNDDGSDKWEMLAKEVSISGSSEDMATVSNTGTSLKKSEVQYKTNTYNVVGNDDFDEKSTFNKLGSTDGSEVIAFEIVQYGGEMDRNLWNGTLKAKLSCVIGTGENLARRANYNSQYDTGISIVGSATDSASFQDMVPPETMYATPDDDQLHDTSIDVTVTYNKDIKLYWVAVPNQELGSNILMSSRSVYNSIQAQNDKSSGYVYNSEGKELSAISSPYTVSVTGLAPTTKYYIYFIAENMNGEAITQYDSGTACVSTITINGNTPAAQYVMAETTEVKAPEFQQVSAYGSGSENYVAVLTDKCTNDQMVFQVLTDKAATIYWVVVTAEDDKTVESIAYSNNTEIKHPQEIASYVKPGLSGNKSSSLTPNSTGLYETEITVTGLNEDTHYAFYAVAESTVEVDKLCTSPLVAHYSDFQLPDLNAPEIESLQFSYMPSTDVTPGKVIAQVRFNKKLYSRNNNSVSALTSDTIKQTNNSTTGSSLKWNFDPSNDVLQTLTNNSVDLQRQYSIDGSVIDGSDSNDSDKPINAVNMSFTYSSAHNNNTYAEFSSKFTICNSSGTIAGQLIVTFEMEGEKCKCTARLYNGTKNTSYMEKTVSGSIITSSAITT